VKIARVAFCFILATTVLQSVRAAEILLNEDFEKLDLKNIPLLYSTYSEDLSIVEDAAQGKVLKISHAGGERPALSVQLDAAKIGGHTLRVSVMAKMPAAFAAVPDKTAAQAYVQLVVKNSDGNDIAASAKILAVEPNKAEWQKLSFTTAVEKDAAYAAVSVGLNWIKADVCFDNLVVELDPETKVATPEVTPKPTPTVPVAPKPPDPTKILADLAEKAPAVKMDMGGINFGPELAAAMQKWLPKITGTKNTIVFAGPGMPMADVDKKLPAGWTGAQSKETCGAAAIPRSLFVTLPDYLAKQKPEIVILFGDANPSRKLDPTERLDWEDLARLCLRMGALPVLATPPSAGNEQKDELRNILIKASEDLHCPLVEARAGLIGARVGELTDMLQRYVLGRVPPDAPETRKSIKSNED
jgi:hypothetical protein